MGIAFKQFFLAITIVFAIVESLAKALLHLAKWSEATAASFEDESSIDRRVKRTQMLLDNNLTEADFNPIVVNATSTIANATRVQPKVKAIAA